VITTQKEKEKRSPRSTPFSINNFTMRSFPPDEAAWRGNTPLSKLIEWSWDKAYLALVIDLTSPFVAAKWRHRWETVKVGGVSGEVK